MSPTAVSCSYSYTANNLPAELSQNNRDADSCQQTNHRRHHAITTILSTVVTIVVVIIVIVIVVVRIIFGVFRDLAAIRVTARRHGSSESRGIVTILVEGLLIVGVDDTNHAVRALGIDRGVKDNGLRVVNPYAENLVLLLSVQVREDGWGYTHVHVIICVHVAREEAGSRIERRARKVVVASCNAVVPTLEVELDNIALSSLELIWVKAFVLAGSYGVSLGVSKRDKSRGGDEALDGVHFVYVVGVLCVVGICRFKVGYLEVWCGRDCL